jgi:CDP-glycerol glycerophosphotransferase
MSSLIPKVLLYLLSILSLFVPKNKKLILFGASQGKYYDGNSCALYQYFIKYHNGGYRCVWMTDSEDVLLYVKNVGGETHLKKSLIGIWLSLRAYLIVTTHLTSDVLLFLPIFETTKELYLHHGATMNRGTKKVFSTDPKALKYSKRIACMIATSLWTVDRQRLITPVPHSRFKITGYPRNDFFFKPDKDIIKSLKEKNNLGKYTILYATSWRKWWPVQFFPFKDLDMEALKCYLKEREITIVIRPHQADLKRQRGNLFWETLQDYNEVIKIITRDEIPDVQPLLYLSDCLITDYSSIQHDYFLLNRPVIYLPYDLAEYSKKVGGFNMDYDEFSPGPKPKTQAEFMDYLEMFMNEDDPFIEKRLKIRDIVHDYKDGQSCRRVFELIKEMTAPV